MSSVESENDTITIDRCGYHLEAPSETDLERLGGPLFARNVTRRERSSHFSMQRGYRRIFPSDEPQLPNLGLLPAIRHRARQNGIDLHINASTSLCQLPAPRINNLRYSELAEFISNQNLGIIDHSKSVSIPDLIRDIHIAFPNQRKIVLCKSRSVQAGLYQKLSPYIPSIHLTRPNQPLNWSEPSDIPRVLIALPFDVIDYDFSQCELVVLPEARTCCQSRTRQALSQIDMRARLYGFHESRFELSPSESDMLMATFGPEHLQICNDAKIGRPVHLITISHRNGYRLPSDQPNFAKRIYWQNRRRNRLICRVARELNCGQLSETTHSQLTNDLPTNSPGGRNITILVDRPMHAIELSNSLADWSVLISPEILSQCPGSFRRRIRNQNLDRCWLESQKRIMLTDYANDQTFDDTDVLIWAAGTPYIDGIPHRICRTSPQLPKPLLIVDINDQGNPDTVLFSRMRRDEFFRRPIFPCGLTTSDGRVAMFLIDQPTER